MRQDDAFTRQRRNLMLFSIGILIYELGGGQMKKEVPVIFGAIELENPEVALYFALIGFFYSLWRYRLYVGGLWGDFKLDYLNTLVAFKPFNELAKSKQKGASSSKTNLRPVILRDGFVFKLDLTKKQTGEGGYGYSPATGVVDVPTLTMCWIISRAWIKTALGKKAFSELILPYLLAYCAAAVVIGNAMYAGMA